VIIATLVKGSLLVLLRKPIAWVAAALVVSAWPAVLSLAPLGITSGNISTTAAAYEIVFMAAVAGAALSCGSSNRITALARCADRGARWVGHLLSIGAAASLLAAVALALPLLSGTVVEWAPARALGTLVWLGACGLCSARLVPDDALAPWLTLLATAAWTAFGSPPWVTGETWPDGPRGLAPLAAALLASLLLHAPASAGRRDAS